MTATLVAPPAPSVEAGQGRAARRVRQRPAARPRPPRPPRSAMSDGATVAFGAVVVLAIVAAWLLVQVLVLGGLSQSRAQTVLRGEIRQQLAAQTAPLGGAIDPGSAVALLTIPTLGLSQTVVEGTAPGDLMAGPGHRRDTVLPGQAGVSLLYGRSSTYGAPFRSVTSLRTGDGISVTTAQGEFVYRVDGVRRQGDPLPVPLAADGARLTLVTTEGQGGFAALSPSRTVYVDATIVGEPATGPAGRPAAVPDAEKALGTDRGVLPVLALALTGLLLAVAALTALRLRGVPGRVLWVVGLPVVTALGWLVSDVAVQLLPNLV